MASLLNTSVGNSVNIVTYNMHGLNQGRVMLSHLCEDNQIDFIFIQEHWTLPFNMNDILLFSDNFIVFGSSAMDDVVERSVLRGRPYGGTALMINKRFSNAASLGKMSEFFVIVKVSDIMLINVYFPCKPKMQDNLNILEEIFTDISQFLLDNNYTSIIFGGDLNNDFTKNSQMSIMIKKFLQDFDLQCTIELNKIYNDKVIDYTFCSGPNGHSSYLDYFFISGNLAMHFCKLDTIVEYPNYSDHVPVLIQMCNIQNLFKANRHNAFTPKLASNSPELWKLRWDHANLNEYYNYSLLYLTPVADKLDIDLARLQQLEIAYTDPERSKSIGSLSKSMYDNGVIYETMKETIEIAYVGLTTALIDASKSSVPLIKVNALKHWWGEELKELKALSMNAHCDWLNAGQPRSGPIFALRNKYKFQYKDKIRQLKASEKLNVSNDLHDSLLNKNNSGFWKMWNNKFGGASKPINLEGEFSEKENAEHFAAFFSKICSPNSNVQNKHIQARFCDLMKNYCGTDLQEIEVITVELLDNILARLKHGKSPGIDGIMAEHLKNSHPILLCILKKLFNLMISVGYVPNGFGLGLTIPIPKDLSSKVLKISNFRGITLSPVVSKVFEHCLLIRFGKFLISAPNQFGFKKGMSCSHAIYAVRSTIDQHIKNDSTISICSLDLSKAFDKVNIHGLLSKLGARLVPVKLIHLLYSWFTKVFTCVKWGNCVSSYYQLTAGVRQGGVLSPTLFAIYVNDVLIGLAKSKLGCHIKKVCLNSVMYADDLVILANSLSDLQKLINICIQLFSELDMMINSSKSSCLRIGLRWKLSCGAILAGQDSIPWCESLRFLGVVFMAGKVCRCNFEQSRCKFYRSFNKLYSKIGNTCSPMVMISLFSSFCIPVLLYGTEAIPMKKCDFQRMQLAYNRAFMKIFGTYDNIIVSQCQYFSGCLPFEMISELRKARFCRKLLINVSHTYNSIFVESISTELKSIMCKYNCNFSDPLGKLVNNMWALLYTNSIA